MRYIAIKDAPVGSLIKNENTSTCKAQLVLPHSYEFKEQESPVVFVLNLDSLNVDWNYANRMVFLVEDEDDY